MGRKKMFLIVGVLVMLALTGCNIFESNNGDSNGGDSTQPIVIEYTAEDIKYYTTAGQEICKNSSGKTSVTYSKTYDGFCAVALANIGDYFGPVLVGEDAAQVCFSQNYNSTITGAGGSIIYNDIEYFYSRADLFLLGKLSESTKYSNYFSKKTTLEEVARELASLATFQKVDESVKKEFIFTELVDGTLSVKAGPYCQGKGELIIPSTYDGKEVSEIESKSFQNLISLKVLRITYNSKIKTIGSYAFQGCSNLKYAVIPQSVTSIGTRAFESCSSELMIYCEAETKPSGYYESTYGGNWYGSADKVWYGMIDYIETELYKYGVKFDGTLSLSKYLGSETDVTIPESYDGKTITSIASNAFDGKNRIKSIVLPSDITSIGYYAFRNCTQLVSVHIPNKTKTIGSYAFQGCSNLKYAVIPQSVTSIGTRAFESCSSELMIYCEAETKPSGYYESTYGGNWYGSADKVWYGTTDYLETEKYRYGIKIDGSYIITKYLGSETEVEIPGEIGTTVVSEIGRYAFEGKNRIKKLSISNTVYKIGNYAFSKCSLLEDVKLNSHLEEIGNYAFMSCSNLTQIVIPQSVTSIGTCAFESCSSELMIYCEAETKPSGYYESTYGGNWYGSGKVYYAGSWAYDSNGNPYVK